MSDWQEDLITTEAAVAEGGAAPADDLAPGEVFSGGEAARALLPVSCM